MSEFNPTHRDQDRDGLKTNKKAMGFSHGLALLSFFESWEGFPCPRLTNQINSPAGSCCKPATNTFLSL
jgi:hypothetical protein